MPEGDTLYRTAAGLRLHLLGRPVIAASARQPGPRAEMLVGATVTLVESRGKHLLIGFDSGLELRTHLGMHGSWHRYAPGEREPDEPGFSAGRRRAPRSLSPKRCSTSGLWPASGTFARARSCSWSASIPSPALPTSTTQPFGVSL